VEFTDRVRRPRYTTSGFEMLGMVPFGRATASCLKWLSTAMNAGSSVVAPRDFSRLA